MPIPLRADIAVGAPQQRFGPPAERRVSPGDIGQRRSRAVDQQLAKVFVAALAIPRSNRMARNWLIRAVRSPTNRSLDLWSVRVSSCSWLFSSINCIVERATASATPSARRGTRPSALKDQRAASAYIFGAICPKDGKGAALVLPRCDTEAMNLHLAT
jgi:hypothetical protein